MGGAAPHLQAKAKLGLAAVSAFVLAASLAACGGSSATANSSTQAKGHNTKTYKLAGIFPLSGADATFGKVNMEGVQVGIDAANAGINGLKAHLSVVPLDGQALPGPSVTAMNNAVHVQNVPVVLTAFSSVTKAIAPIANQTNTVLIQGGASSPALAKLGQYVFNDVPLADLQAPAVIDYTVNTLGLKKWAVVYSDEPLGQGLLQVLQKSLPSKGASVVNTVGVSVDQSDFSSAVAKVAAAKPDVVYLATSIQHMTTLMSQLRKSGVTAQFLTFAGTDSPEVIASPDAAGMLLTGQAMDFQNGNAFTKFFNQDFAKRYPDAKPNTVTANYANAAIIVAQAIDYVNSHGGTVNGQSIHDAILKIGTFQVVGGSLTFQPNGTVSTPIDIIKIQNGALSTVKTYPSGSGQ